MFDQPSCLLTSDGVYFVDVLLDARLIKIDEELSEHFDDVFWPALTGVARESSDIREEHRDILDILLEVLLLLHILEELGEHMLWEEMPQERVFFYFLRVEPHDLVEVIDVQFLAEIVAHDLKQRQ